MNKIRNAWGYPRRPRATMLVVCLAVATAAQSVKAEAPVLLQAKGKIIADIAFSPDGTMLAAASWDGTVKRWDVKRRKALEPLVLRDARPNALAFSPDGRLLAVGSSDKRVTLYRSADLEVVRVLQQANPGWSVVFSPDGKRLAAGTTSWIILWSTSGEKLAVRNIGDGYTSVAFSPDGTRLAAAANSDTARLFDVSDDRLKQLHVIDRGLEMTVSSLAFSPDGKTLVAADFWHLRSWNLAGPKPEEQGKRRWADSNDVNDIAFSPDGKTLASTGEDAIRLWQMTGKGLGKSIKLPGQTGRASAVGFSANGKWLASGSEDGSVRLWEFDKNWAKQGSNNKKRGAK